MLITLPIRGETSVERLFRVDDLNDLAIGLVHWTPESGPEARSQESPAWTWIPVRTDRRPEFIAMA